MKARNLIEHDKKLSCCQTQAQATAFVAPIQICRKKGKTDRPHKFFAFVNEKRQPFGYLLVLVIQLVSWREYRLFEDKQMGSSAVYE